VDGEIAAAPVIREKIPEGRFRIDLGVADPAQARVETVDLMDVLKAGPLPAPIELVRREPPSAGQR
jgi:preprotein translocase subunit SecD